MQIFAFQMLLQFVYQNPRGGGDEEKVRIKIKIKIKGRGKEGENDRDRIYFIRAYA